MIDADSSRITRATIAVAITVVATATGLFWNAERAERSVDASVTLTTTATLTGDGVLHVAEELLIDDHGGSITRVLPAAHGVTLKAVRGDAGIAVPHRSVLLAEGLAVTVTLDTPSAVVRLDYDLVGAASVTPEAVELEWPLTDDRNSLAIRGLDAEVRWASGGAPIAVEVDAPGSAPTVLPLQDGVRIEFRSLSAHHLVALHASLPPSALEDGVLESAPEDAPMSVGMIERAVGRGGPWWLPLAVALAASGIWVVTHSRAPEETPLAWTGVIARPPSSDSPALIGWLLRRGAPDADDMVATLADLHGRDVVDLTEDGWSTAPGRDAEGLRPHEAILFSWMFADGATASVAALEARARTDPAGWRRTRRAFVDAVEAAGRDAGLLDRSADSESVLGAGVAAAAMVVLGVIGTSLGQLRWIVCIVVGAAAVVSTGALARRSASGAQLATEWLAFAPTLTNPDLEPGLRGYAYALGVRSSQDDHVLASAVHTLETINDAFVTATSFVAGPHKRAVRRTAQGHHGKASSSE